MPQDQPASPIEPAKNTLSQPSQRPIETQAIYDEGPALLDWVFLLGCLAILGLAFTLQPNGAGRFYVPMTKTVLPETCMARRLFGWTCPGCGLTRSVVGMANGEWRQSIQMNPAGPLFFLMFVLQVPYRIVRLWRRTQSGIYRRSHESAGPRRGVIASLVVNLCSFLVSGRYAMLTMAVMFLQWLLRPIIN